MARAGRVQPITESVVEAASLISRRLNAALLVVATSSGRTALVLSKHRNPAPTLALANDPQTARAMALFWGVTPLPRPDVANREELRAFVLDWCRQKRPDPPGDRIVGIRGSWSDDPTHNEIVVPRGALHRRGSRRRLVDHSVRLASILPGQRLGEHVFTENGHQFDPSGLSR